MRQLYALFFTLMCAVSLQAQTTIWLGGSTDWDDPTNWTDGVPVSGGTATIPGTPPNGPNFPIFTGGPLLDFTIQSFGGNLIFDAVIYNTGSIINSGGGSIISNQVFINAGMVEFNNNDGTFVNNGTVDNYGTFNNAGTSTLENPAGSVFNNYGDIDNFGTINNDGTLTNTGTITSTSTIVNNGALTNSGFLDIAFGGSFTNGPSASIVNQAGAFVEVNSDLVNDGTILTDGSWFVEIASIFDNNGTLTSNAIFDLSGRINNTGTFTNNNVMSINDSGKFDNQNVLDNNGTITLSICAQIIQNANNVITGTILSDGIVYEIAGTVDVTDNLEFGSEFSDLNQRKAPDTKCRSGILVFLDENGEGSLDIDRIDKNSFGFCGANLATRVLSQSTFTAADLGVQQIELTITDDFGESSSCIGFITVIDYFPPIVPVDDPDIDFTCPADITVTPPPGGTVAVANWVTPTVTNNCTTTTGGGNLPSCAAISNSINGFAYLGEFNNSKYFLSNTSVGWHAARDGAIANNGHLVSINDAAENSFIAGQISANTWIGLNDQASEGTFQWLNGDPVTYTNWNSGEPNDFGTGEDVAEIRANGSWNDQNANSTRRYIVEIACSDAAPSCVDVSEAISGFTYIGEFNDSKYYRSTSTANYFQANNVALANEAHLVTISNAAENTFVRNALATGTSTWLGISDAATEGTWEWTNGETANYFNWASGEPNEGTNANHARLVKNSGRWTDRNGTNNSYVYIIERDCQQGPPACLNVNENIAGATFIGEFGDSKYFVSNAATNWTGAQSIAESNGGHLAVIDSQEENDFIRNNTNPSSGSVWIGLRNLNTGSVFNWVTNSALTYTNWLTGEPNGSANTHAVRLKKNDGKWTDRPASDQYEYVFEIPCGGNGGGGTTDPTGGLVFNQISGAPSGSSFSVGETIIGYRAADDCGNEEICTFTITVNPNPAEITVTECPADIVVSTEPGAPAANVIWAAPTATTDCFKPNTIVEQTIGAESGTDFLIGSRTIAYAITDSCGNFQPCSFNVTVQQVNAILSLDACPIDQTVIVNAGETSGTATWTEPTGTSDCYTGTVQANRLVGPASGSAFDLGTTQVVYVLTDQCGNSELCAFNITVAEACPAAGTTCNDGDASTFNDVEDGNCNCAGTACPTSGTTCDDSDASTFNDVEDGECNCEGTPCPVVGTTCDDGNPNTENDVEDGECNCEGTEIQCPAAGTACDDGNPNTENDVEDGNCNCEGTEIQCPAVGTLCDDNDATTFDDQEDGNCNCVGTPCPVAGTTCDDGDATTENDVADGTCGCAGTPIVQGCGSTENLATKPSASATQSSTQGGGEASRAIDGNTSGDFFGQNSVSLTNWETNAWLEIDLGLVSNIETVNIYNREDCCQQFLSNYYVLVSSVPFTSTDLNATLAQAGVESFLQSDEAARPAEATINASGRYVRIQLAGTSFLGLAEVEVIGCVGGSGCAPVGTVCDDNDPTTFDDQEDGDCGCAGTPCPTAGTTCDDGNANTENDVEDGECGCAGTPVGGACASTSNLAIDGTPTQSSTQQGAEASRATDGNTSGNFFGQNSVSLTNWETQPWVEVDLGAVANIESVNVWNRTDCCADFLKNYHFLVSDVPFTSSVLSATLAQSGVSDYFEADAATTPSSININRTGRYVRLQLQGSSFLGLAELEIIGCIDGGACPAVGTACDDNDASTFNDVEDGDCGCAGTACPTVGTTCDDGDADTINDVEDGNCNCAGTPTSCPTAGTACDDGDASTFNDVEDGNCGCAGTACPVAGTTCDDGNAMTENDVEDGECNCAGTPINTGGCTITDNLALNGTASQSSTLTAAGITGSASKAIDGNTNGVYFTTPSESSVSATTNTSQAYWEVELDNSYLIEQVDVYNRTDGSDRSNDVYVLVSNTPFTAADLAGARAEADYEMLIAGLVGSPSSVNPNIVGQYVRVQMQGSGYLVLAEVEVMGCVEPVPTQNLVAPNLLYFNAKKRGIHTVVDWMMSKDNHVDFYEVEVSTDGTNFQLLDERNADRASAARQYDLVDLKPAHGENFYRLKINQLDGQYFYSKVRRLNFDIDFDEVIVYPNPASERVHIALRDFVGKSGTIEIYNSLGQKMAEREYQSFPSVPTAFDVTNFVDGIYTISIKVENHKRFTKKIIVNKL